MPALRALRIRHPMHAGDAAVAADPDRRQGSMCAGPLKPLRGGGRSRAAYSEVVLAPVLAEHLVEFLNFGYGLRDLEPVPMSVLVT